MEVPKNNVDVYCRVPLFGRVEIQRFDPDCRYIGVKSCLCYSWRSVGFHERFVTAEGTERLSASFDKGIKLRIQRKSC